MKRYVSQFKEKDAIQKFNIELEKVISLLIQAKDIHDKKFLHQESVNRFKGNMSTTSADKEFNDKLRQAGFHLLKAGEHLDKFDLSENLQYNKNQLLLARIHLVGNTNLLTSEYLKSSGHSGENIRSLLIELVQSKKLTPQELLTVNTQVAVFLPTLLSYNGCVEELESKYKNEISKDLRIKIKNSKSIEDTLKRIS